MIRPFPLNFSVLRQNHLPPPFYAMRTAYWDSGDPEMYFDNPNLRWGSPAYLLEPGDPGYVPPAPSATETTTKNKRKHMKRNTYFPLRVGDQLIWIGNFRDRVSALATTLGLTPAQVTAILADCNWLLYVLQTWLPEVRTWALGCTTAATAAQTGTGPVQVLPVFAAPALPSGVTPVTLGALNRIFALVQQIKDSGKCTDDIAANLRIVGTAEAGPDFTSIAPVFTAAIVGNQVILKWNWGGYAAFLDSCEIQVDRGDGHGYVFLTIDTTPGYTDTQPFPTAKTVWTYRAIYRVGDAQAGVWSQPVSLAVAA